MAFSLNKALLDIYFEYDCTQRSFAEVLDRDYVTINNWLNMRQEMRYSEFEKVIDKLGKKIKIVIE